MWRVKEVFWMFVACIVFALGILLAIIFGIIEVVCDAFSHAFPKKDRTP